MKRNLNFLFSLPLLILLVGCGNADYERNQDGLIYKIHKVGKGEKIKPKSFLKVHQKAYMDDTVFINTFDKLPAYGFFDSLTAPTHDFLDILDQMRVGDSAIVIRAVDTLAKRGMLNYNDRFKKGSTIKVIVKVLAVLPSEQALEDDRQKEMDAYKKAEIADLEKHVSGLKLSNVNKKPEGVFIQIEKEGTGLAIESGDEVSMKYTGKLLDGTVFDSNIDTTFGHTDPFNFTVGMRQVIEGWDLGVLNLKQGTKAKLFIPSMLGYGPQAQGPNLPAYSNLVFDVEVLNVKKAQSKADSVGTNQ
jgi:FKBP-type peptidyl-prolyl cis-trans isomerase